MSADVGPSREVSLPFSIGATVWPGLSKLIEEAGEVVQVSASGGQDE